jgi:hypothetical protein
MNHYTTTLVTSQPMNVTSTTTAHSLLNNNGHSIQAVYTGSSINGTLSLSVSSDPIKPDSTTPPADFAPLLNSSTTVTGAGVFIWNITQPYYNWVQVVYTDASSGASNGLMTVSITAKDYI